MPLNHVNIDAATGIVEYLDSKFIYVSPSRELKINRSVSYAGILLDGKNPEFTRMVLKRIRGNDNPQIYLKPVIIVNGNSHRDPFVKNLIDGVIFSFDQIPLVEEVVNRINELTDKLSIINSISFEAVILSKLLYFMYTREARVLEPIPYALSNMHYSFPFLACNFSDFEETKVLDILEMAWQDGVFIKRFQDRVYLCANCQSGHLSYRETCTKCASPNTESFDIVHHFPCAYVGPINDFSNDLDDQLNCPKCLKRLRHIGVDYDKPSVLHICKNCDNRFQDFNVRARCMSCTHDNPVATLVSKEIAEYELTRKGESHALSGYVSTPKDIEEIIGTVKFDTFKTVVRYEIERVRQDEISSNIVAISITNAGHMYAKLGATAQQGYLKDIVAEIRSSIRSSDMITFSSSSVILVTMFAIPQKIAQRFIDDVVKILEKLTEDNFKDIEVTFKADVRQLNTDFSSELQINQLISK